MRVTLFANVSPKINPYIALLQQAIQPYCGGEVAVQPRFSLGWVLRSGRGYPIAHIHWIEAHLRPRPWFGRHPTGYRHLISRLGSNRLTRPIRATILLGRLALALVLARWAGVRVVYTVHNLTSHHDPGSIYVLLNRLANRLIFAWADAVHVHNRHTAEAIARLYGRTRNVFVIPHGNYVGWYPNAISRDEARAHLGLPQDAFAYLFLGQIAPYKGLEDLLDAFVALDSPEAWLVIAGRVDKADYGARIAAMARHPRVLYRPGFVPDEDVQVYFNAADIVVLPYRKITTSGSALLAFSFGCPVIAPAFPLFADLVDEERGVLYDPADPQALRLALERAGQVDWRRFRPAIQRWVRQFDWSLIGAQWSEVYQSLAGAEALSPGFAGVDSMPGKKR